MSGPTTHPKTLNKETQRRADKEDVLHGIGHFVRRGKESTIVHLQPFLGYKCEV
jgi:hypothetical protein